MPRPLALAFLAAALGCSAAPAPVPGTAPASASATASAPASAPAPVPASATASAPASPFSLVAPYDFTLEPITDGGGVFALLRGDRVETDPTWTQGIDVSSGNAYNYVTWISGRWPDPVFIAAMRTDGRRGWSDVYRRQGSSWAKVRSGLNSHGEPHSWVYLGVRPWSEGRLLAVARSGHADADMKFEVVAGTPPRPMPKPTLAEGSGTIVGPQAFATLPTGHLFVFGNNGTMSRYVERWEPGKAESTIDTIPSSFPGDWDYLTMQHVLARSPTEVYVLSPKRYDWKDVPAYLSRFDGHAWHMEELPTQSSGTSLSAEPDGTLWVSTTSEVFRKKPDGAWEQVPLPTLRTPDGKPAKIEQVHAAGPGDVWLATEAGLFTTRAKKPEFTQDIQDTLDGRPSFRIPHAATADCDHVFALLFTLARSAPPDYDFPLTREALKGHTELTDARFVETEENGRRYFGAFVPTLALGKKLVKIVGDKVQGSSPQLLCHEPRVRRAIKLDLRTGAIVP